jgi:sulfotransferase family protein
VEPGGPNIIGASGGSGTRAFALIARRAGLYTGSELNDSEDAVAFGDYSDRWINRYLTTGDSQEMRSDLHDVLTGHLAGMNGAPAWGWKEPRSIYLLPFFDSELPGLRFVHVVRDGRDMAFSTNQNQLRKHGSTALGPDWDDAPDPVRSIALWSWINHRAADYGERELGDRYLRLRFEDLCDRPRYEIRRLLAFLELDGDVDALAREVQPPAIGRWRTQPPEVVDELERAAGHALSRFGYA